MTDVLQLYPASHRQRTLNGLYLGLNLHRQAEIGDVLIYANYIASVDGRIAVRDEGSGEFVVPPAIANKRDWRLYQELAAQADVMLTSARYFRQLATGVAIAAGADVAAGCGCAISVTGHSRSCAGKSTGQACDDLHQ